MPIEIKEISIKADVFPGRHDQEATITPAELERIKQEIKEEVTLALIREFTNAIER
ncbi:hypothetical protein SAMN05444266_103193 [Chitinophaga jiangningensis]|uniref:Uncharacterized protein n=1 Tax=Chitinophaga jiangningensis TaxID=1419482 RepID=A0A1M7AAA8_9BACT|nr:DUF5908 family protein [Chitinophaga jiangningensis]SHL39602.1 hypothetical protein SAMN05444266_103193 [Chitinophaga jiangningensis]